MFDLSFEKLLVLVVAALFILGPERLPGAAAWLGQTVRKVKEFGSGAQEQIRRELGPEFEEISRPLAELRAPLQELRALRDPRAAVMRHLLADPAPAVPATVVLTKPVAIAAYDSDAT
ncbi:twin-arginine translocase TatA/TatE family subunit [Pseudonocardia sp. GCM10023141]|uniref:twin-arginine translocase TatA/TatE family subunit n=1 Tax=Pseudonocardia sp. GCM10023141 TaxID=3252653 RepID=UPI0036235252